MIDAQVREIPIERRGVRLRRKDSRVSGRPDVLTVKISPAVVVQVGRVQDVDGEAASSGPIQKRETRVRRDHPLEESLTRDFVDREAPGNHEALAGIKNPRKQNDERRNGQESTQQRELASSLGQPQLERSRPGERREGQTRKQISDISR